MLKYAFIGLVAVLCTIGISNIMSWLFSLFYKDFGGEMIIIPISGHMEDIEFIIRGVMLKCRRVRKNIPKIYVVDNGADAETMEIAKKMCSEQIILEYVDKGNLESVMTKLRKN